MSDQVSDMLARIKNGYLARKRSVAIPHSGVKEQIAKLLLTCEYLGRVEVETNDKKFKDLVLDLKYNKGEPSVTNIKRVSKPGLRVYAGKGKIPRVLSGLGTTIVSTSQGIMTGAQATKKG